MTTAPKRRGRPPGTKNESISVPRETLAAGGWFGKPEPTRRIVIRWKVGLAQPGQEAELDWPETWPLPQPGDMIQWGEKELGFLSHVVFDLPNGRIVFQVR
jgi:hypothetical protein